MTDAEKLRAISDIIVRWVNEPYSDIGGGQVGPPEREYLDEILDVLTSDVAICEKCKARGVKP